MDLLTGSAGADAFYGSIIDDLNTGTTLNPGDNLNGGAGDDTLNLTLSGNPSSTFLVQTTSVEQINVGNFDTNNASDATLSMSSATGVTGVGITGGNGDTIITGLAALVALSNTSGTGDMTLTYASGVLAGTADTQKVTVNNTGLSTDSVTVKITDAASAAAETLEITSNGSANFLTLSTDSNHKTVTATGAGALTINADTETSITKIDGSALTKSLTVANLGASNIAITGSAGNDTIVDTGANFDVKDTIAGGEGTDSLGLTAAITAANAKNITGFEALVLGDNVSQAVNAFTGVTTLVVDHTAVNGTSDADNKTSAFTAAAGTESLAIRTQGIDDDVTVSLASNGTNDSIAVALGTATAGVTVDVLDLDNYETITLSSGGAANTITDLTASSLKTLNIAGSKAITIDANGTGTWNALKTVDASTATADVTLGALDAAGTITGGSGNDTFSGSGSADSISGGAGNDGLTGGGGNDTLAGGDGNDTITATGASQDVITGGAGDDTITGATGNDNIDGGDGNDTFVINATDAAPPVLDISSADTIVGGAGTDTLRIDGAYTAARTIDLSGTTETRLAGVSGVEKITLNSTGGTAANGATVLKVGDIAMGAFSSSLTVDVTSGNVNNHSVDASAVLNTSAKVTFNGNSGINTYTLGNGVDVINLSSGDDITNVTNILFLQAGDTLVGGAGADTLAFDTNATTSITAAQLAGVSGFETFSIDTTAGTEAYTVAINDAIVTANKDGATDTLTITRAAENGTLKIDASAITTGKLAITGGSGADTITGGTLADALTGGAGADSIVGGAGNDSITGGAGIDTVTGGAGVDTFKVSAVTSADRNKVTDFTAGTGGDVFNLNSGVATLSGSDNFASSSSLQAHSAAGALTVLAASEVVIITSGTIANNLALTTTANDLDGTNLLTAVGGGITTQAAGVNLYAVADQFGNVGIYYAANTDTDGGGADTNTALAAGEISLVGVLQNTSLSSLVFGNFGNAA